MPRDSNPNFELDTTGLDHMIKAFKKFPTIKVGILGSKSARPNETTGITNAQLGVWHEYGTEHMPRRSFLRMPISMLLHDSLINMGMYSEKALTEVFEKGHFNDWARQVGHIAEEIVGDAFKTGGFTTWEPSDFSRKKVHETLVETQQLRNSITSEVDE